MWDKVGFVVFSWINPTLRVVPILKFIFRLTIVLLVQNYLHVFHQNQKNSQWKSLESIQSTICLTEVQLLRSTRRRKKGFKSSFFPIYNGAVPNALKMGCSHMSYAYAMDSHNISPFTMASMRPEAIIMMTSWLRNMIMTSFMCSISFLICHLTCTLAPIK